MVPNYLDIICDMRTLYKEHVYYLYGLFSLFWKYFGFLGDSLINGELTRTDEMEDTTIVSRKKGSSGKVKLTRNPAEEIDS